MTIQFEIPSEIDEQLRASGIDPSQTAKELFLVDLYRNAKLTHHELGKLLGLSRYETDTLLKRHDVPIDLSLEELQAETAFLEKSGRQ